MNNFLLPVVLSLFSHYSDISKSDTLLLKQTMPIESSFSSIIVYNDINLFITEGSKNEIITENQNVADAIKFKVKDEILIIHRRNSFLHGKIHGKIIVCVKYLHGITIMGDAEVRTIGNLNYRSLKLEIFGDGAIYANTMATEVNTFMKGLGKIEVKGNFKNTTVNKDADGDILTTYN